MAGPLRRPGLKDVAARAGVSTATVSYVLSGKRTVAPATARHTPGSRSQTASPFQQGTTTSLR